MDKHGGVQRGGLVPNKAEGRRETQGGNFFKRFTICASLLLIWLAGCAQEPPAEPADTAVASAPTRVVTATTTALIEPADTPANENPYPAPASPIATTPASNYPAASPSPTNPPEPYPIASPSPTPLPPSSPTAQPGGGETYLPFIGRPAEPTPTPTEQPRPTKTPTPTPLPTVDFVAVQADLDAQGQALAFSKMGFHVGVGGNRDGLGTWMQRHTEAGAPFFLKSVSDAGPLVEAQNMIRASGVPHVLVYRHSGDEYDTPNYALPPAEAAREHWAKHMAVWPPELDPELVWLETINEVDKNRAEWLGQFALETAALAERDGFRWAAFGWSSGEPEPEQWQTPAMLQFLRLAASRPERLAIALHEYSYTSDDIGDAYPYKVGRFQQLFQVCDANGIPRPTVLITEWGWEYQDNPPLERALDDIEWAAGLYAAYPQVKGAAIWYLGPGFGGIAEETQKLIRPVTEYNLGHYFAIAPGQPAVEPDRYRP